MKNNQIDKTKSYKIIATVILAVAIACVVIFCFIVTPMSVQGESMAPTLADGEMIFVDKTHRSPKANDVIVYKKESDNLVVIKRVVGVAGDSFIIKAEDLNQSTISFALYKLNKNNHQELVCPLNAEQYTFLQDLNGSNIFTVSENTVFCVGDNYEVSVDSRIYGFVNTSSIIGTLIGHQK